MNAQELADHTAAQRGQKPAEPTTESDGVIALRAHYNARRDAMQTAFRLLSALDDSARAAVAEAVGNSQAARLLTDLQQFKARAAKLLNVSAAEADKIK